MVTFLLGKIVPLTVVFPIVIGMVRYYRFPYYLRVMVVFALVSGITNVACILMANRGSNNMPFFHFFTVASFIICSLFYKEVLAGTKVEKGIVPIILAFLAFATVSTICWQGFLEFNSFTLTFETVVMIVYSLLLFYKLLGSDLNNSKSNAPLIYINVAFFLYFCGSLFLFAFPQLLTAPKWVYSIGWIIHGILVLLMYAFFSIAFIKYKAPK